MEVGMLTGWEMVPVLKSVDCPGGTLDTTHQMWPPFVMWCDVLWCDQSPQLTSMSFAKCNSSIFYLLCWTSSTLSARRSTAPSGSRAWWRGRDSTLCSILTTPRVWTLQCSVRFHSWRSQPTRKWLNDSILTPFSAYKVHTIALKLIYLMIKSNQFLQYLIHFWQVLWAFPRLHFLRHSSFPFLQYFWHFWQAGPRKLKIWESKRLAH